MSSTDYSPCIQKHVFDEGNPAAERGVRIVLVITAVMMVIEIVAGLMFNSMALLADGWHMASHTVAIGLSAVAYAAARRLARDRRFAFGTWKLEILGGFTSALLLLGIACVMVYESIGRLLDPSTIDYGDALIVAVVGFVVNIVCALLLARAQGHDHGHGHSHDDHDDSAHATNDGRAHNHNDHDEHDHGHSHTPGAANAGVHDHVHTRDAAEPGRGEPSQVHDAVRARDPAIPKSSRIAQPHEEAGAARTTPGKSAATSTPGAEAHDLNLRAAYVHVVTDAATSVLAVIALAGGLWKGWAWLDPAMGIIGAIVVSVWAVGLVKASSRTLLDGEMDHPLARSIRKYLEQDFHEHGDVTRLVDLHLWRVGRKKWACIVSVETRDTHLRPSDVKAELASFGALCHVTVEINPAL